MTLEEFRAVRRKNATQAWAELTKGPRSRNPDFDKLSSDEQQKLALESLLLGEAYRD